MSLKDSLKKMNEQENINLKRELVKELTKIKNLNKKNKKCVICFKAAKYLLKGTNNYYCKDCALENFSDLKHLKKI